MSKKRNEAKAIAKKELKEARDRVMRRQPAVPPFKPTGAVVPIDAHMDVEETTIDLQLLVQDAVDGWLNVHELTACILIQDGRPTELRRRLEQLTGELANAIEEEMKSSHCYVIWPNAVVHTAA